MESYTFEDVLCGSSVSCQYPGMRALSVDNGTGPRPCTSLFFPGCSLLNYGMPLVSAVFNTLQDGDAADGISLLCCGKILSYEPDGEAVRAAYEKRLVQHIAESGVKRIIAACPNCLTALENALGDMDVEVVALPQVLADLGYQANEEVARQIIDAEYSVHGDLFAAAAEEVGAEPVVLPGADKPILCIHDSCPDRETGRYAAGIRALLPDSLFTEAAHNRKKSFCCGSLVRAKGKFDAAKKQAMRHGEEAIDAQVAGIASSCISCTYLLSTAQHRVPAFHYLELLYAWRIDWYRVDEYMKLRFLFENSYGVRSVAKGEGAAKKPSDKQGEKDSAEVSMGGSTTNPRGFVGI